MQRVFEALAPRVRRQFIPYRQVPDSLISTLHGFVQEACPTSRPLERESAALSRQPGRRKA